MKLIKKNIASLLLIILLFSSFTSYGYYAENSEGSSLYPKEYITAVNTLYGLGVLPDNNLENYEKNVSYGDFVKYLYALCDMSAPEDMTQNKASITFIDAIKLVVDITEHSVRAEHYGGMPSGYRRAGTEMDITHGLNSLKDYDLLPYGAVVQMLYNTMRVTPGNATYSGSGDFTYTYDSERTVLTEYLDIEVRKGYVTADEFWSITPDVNLTEGTVVINGQSFVLKNPLSEDFVGFYVDYYYDQTENRVVALEKNKNAKITVLNCTDDIQYENGKYTYKNEDKKEVYNLSASPIIIQNYTSVLAPNPDMQPDKSDIVLVDGDGDNKYETIFFKKYVEFVVSTVDPQGTYISSNSASYKFNEDKPVKIYYNGKKVEYTGVKSGMLASVILDGNNDCREIYLSDKKISGNISVVSGSGELKEVEISGTTYMISASCMNKDALKLNTSGVFYLNFKGEIASYGNEGDSSEKLAYLFQIARTRGVSREIEVELFEANGEFKIYAVSKKCKLNGEKVDDLLSAFVDGENTKQQLICYKTNAEGQIINIETAREDASDITLDDRVLHECVSGASWDTMGNKILTNNDTVKFTVPFGYSEDENQFYSGTLSWVNAEGKAFAFKKNSPFADVVITYSKEALPEGLCGGKGPDITYNDDLCVVTDVKKAYVERYDEYIDKINFRNIKSGKEETLILADNAQWVAWSGTSTVVVSSYTNTGKYLKPGDVFQYSVNARNEIGTVHKFYDASERVLVKGTGVNGTTSRLFDYTVVDAFGDYDAFQRIIVGYPVSTGSDYVMIARDEPTNLANVDRENIELYQKVSESTFCSVKYNHGEPTATSVSLAAIPPSNDNDHIVFTYVVWGRLRTVVAYDYTE